MNPRADLNRELKRRRRHLERTLEPKVKAAVAASPLMAPDYALKIVVAQNLLRECMEVAIAESLPVGRDFFIELGTRLAAYCLTALEPDYQEVGATFIRDGLLNKLADMQAQGIVIHTEWE